MINNDNNMKKALKLNVIKNCNKTRARISILELPHSNVNLPIFMPVIINISI